MYHKLQTLVQIWFFLDCLAIVLAMFRKDQDMIFGDVVSVIFSGSNFLLWIFTFVVVLVFLPFTIFHTIYNIFKK